MTDKKHNWNEVIQDLGGLNKKQEEDKQAIEAIAKAFMKENCGTEGGGNNGYCK
jgi:hypothetical protein